MIYIDRIITILNNEATIEQPIVLYKGDKNVQLLFTLKDNPLKYKSMENAYGQLIIKRTANPIFSEVARLSSNKVTFIVTGEMIDELAEVGNYDFQIRLFSQDKTSRATLPPISEGIVIREPILEEDTPNEVGIATVNETQVMAEDTELEVFDEEGNYNKTTWQNGDIISDVKLNKIEEAIYQINEKEVEVDLSTLATKEELNEGLETKANEEHTHEEYAPLENPSFTNNICVGENSYVYSSNSSAFGNSTVLENGKYSFAIGCSKTASEYQFVSGKNNILDASSYYAHIVGNGTFEKNSNAYTLDWSGNGWYQGNVSIDGTPTEEKHLTTKKYTDNTYATKGHTHDEYVSSLDLLLYAKTEDLHSHTNKTILDGITEEKITEWDNKSDFSGNYDNLINKPYIPSIEGLATEEYVNTAIAQAQLGGEDGEIDLSGYALKTDLNNYAPIEHTHEEYLTEHQDISGKVDKEEGKSLISDTEIERLSTLENYDDTEIRGLIEVKADKEHTHEEYLTEHQDINHLALKTELHEHENKTILDTITEETINTWNNKSEFDGDYNSLTNQPTIPSIEGLASEEYVDEKIANIEIKDNLETVVVESNLLALTTNKYQYVEISGDTEIVLPTVDTFKEIHLFFKLESDFANTIELSANEEIICQAELEFEGDYSYEIIATFIPNIGWLVGQVRYGEKLPCGLCNELECTCTSLKATDVEVDFAIAMKTQGETFSEYSTTIESNGYTFKQITTFKTTGGWSNLTNKLEELGYVQGVGYATYSTSAGTTSWFAICWNVTLYGEPNITLLNQLRQLSDTQLEQVKTYGKYN